MHPHNDLVCDYDCLVCGEHVDTQQPHRQLQVVAVQAGDSVDAGTVNTLEQWVICPTCDTIAGGAAKALVEAVKNVL